VESYEQDSTDAERRKPMRVVSRRHFAETTRRCA